MPLYEHTLIARPDLSAQQAQTLAEELGAIAELERNERIHDDVVRYLTVKIEAIDPEPSIVMQVKSSRDDRRRDRP